MNSHTQLARAFAMAMLASGLGACGMFRGQDRADVQYVDEPVAEQS
jgi:hypothetical protein